VPSGEITAQDVQAIRALCFDVRTTSMQVDDAMAPINGLIGRVEQLIGGTASGKDREFVERLQQARRALTEAQRATSDGAGSLARAERHAELLLREQQERDRQRSEGLRRV